MNCWAGGAKRDPVDVDTAARLANPYALCSGDAVEMNIPRSALLPNSSLARPPKILAVALINLGSFRKTSNQPARLHPSTRALSIFALAQCQSDYLFGLDEYNAYGLQGPLGSLESRTI
jgi:hypothetical protein